MNLSELVEECLENCSASPKYQSIQRGEIKRLLNLAQREISLRIGAPRVEVTIPQTGVITGPFRLPGRFHPEAVQRVVVLEGIAAFGGHLHGQELRILSPGETFDFYSHMPWHHPHDSSDEPHHHHAPALKYDRADTELVFTPMGIEEARYHFILNPIPADMVADTDEPFAAWDWCEEPPVRTPGALPGGHRVLAHHVTYELLQRWGDERWQAFYARYREMEKDLYARVSPTTVYLPGFRIEVSRG